jgi:hypothetical protein
MKFSKIANGQYTVKMKLNEYLSNDEIKSFKNDLVEIGRCYSDFKDICKLKGNTLEYVSETVLPLVDECSKEKLLFVFGNPAIHSVKSGMFFFARKNTKRHSIWGKLSKANLMHEFKSKKMPLIMARKEEAKQHKYMIHNGTSSTRYLVGLTTFFSFPTPIAKGCKFSNVAGVEKIFAQMLDTLIRKEIERIKSYSFFENAKLIFVQKSTYKAFREASNQSPLFWPIRGKGSSWQALSDLLQSQLDSRNHSQINAFHLSIGGYFGASYSLELKGYEITYKIFRGGYEIENSEMITTTLAQLNQFMEEIKEIGVFYWKKRYVNPQILDGTSWTISIDCAGKRFESSGSNAYPKGFDEFTKSVRKLLNNKPFQ